MEPNRDIVIIPTYNEKVNISLIIQAVLNLERDVDILVVDDNSPDGTADIVKEIMVDFPGRVHILEREGKLGLGTAYIAGFRYCLEKGYEHILEMDADFSHNPNDIPRLIAACESGADLSVGSRYVKGGKVENWPLLRIFISFFASLYVRAVLWINVRDTTAGFVCYHRRVLEKIDLNKIDFIGYAFQIEMKYKARKNGFKIKEVPITFKDRLVGQSKMSMNIFNEALVGVIKMRFS